LLFPYAAMHKEYAMTLLTLMQAGPAKAQELFVRLSETSDGAVKTRERLFAELKTELETHVDLEERHLFPILKKHAETRDLVGSAIRDNKELRARLDELERLPKNHETFLEKLADLRKEFRQHARDEKKELLPAVQRALSEEQVQGIADKIETSLAEAEQAKKDQAEEKRANNSREREQAELEAQKQAAEREWNATERHTGESSQQTAETAREVGRDFAEGAQSFATAPLSTGFFFWDLMLGMRGAQQEISRGTHTRASTARNALGHEEVIPLAEETLIVGKRVVESGTTRVRRYVVHTPVEQQVALYDERVVVERRRPVADAPTGETLTELTIEVVETSEVPVVGKSVYVREEVVVRRERTKRTETVRGTVRRDEVEVEQPHNNERHARTKVQHHH